MDVSFQCDSRCGVTEHLAERLDLKADLNAPCSKGMAKRMEMDIFNIAGGAVFLDFVLQGARFYVFPLASCQKKCSRICAVHMFPAQLKRRFRQRNNASRGVCFRLGEDDFCLSAAVKIFYSPHGFAHGNGFLL